MQLPQARIVKQGGQLFAPPPPLAPARRPGAVKEQFREAAELAVGMWPLIAIMLLMVGFLIVGANWDAP